MFLRSLLTLLILFGFSKAEASAYLFYFCGNEMEKLCKNDQNSYLCLKKFPKDRGAVCNTAFLAYEKELNTFLGPCLNDSGNACKHVEPGFGKIQPCLEKNISKMTPACQAHIKAPYESKFDDLPFESQIPCAVPLKKLCSNVKYGANRLINCLKDNIKKIEVEKCKTLVSSYHVFAKPPK
jgi:hypothetical protein